MKIKQMTLIITFSTTASAMKMERYCTEREIFGRLIPVPTSIMAGCGLAWKTKPELQEELIQRFAKDQINWEKMYLMEI